MNYKFRNHIKDNPFITTFVSKSNKIIYLRPGRTAGTDITNSIRGSGNNDFEEVSRPYFFQNGTNEWLENITDDEVRDYFKFTFVRNPFTRLISAWNGFVRKGSVSRDFKSFVVDRGPGHLLYENGEFSNDHWFPQCNYAQFPDGEMIVDFVGKFEQLKSDTEKLTKMIKFNGIAIKQNVVNSHREHYQNGLQNIVSNIYKKDLELFNYEF